MVTAGAGAGAGAGASRPSLPRDIPSWTLGFRLWALDFGRWTLDVGRWTLDFGRWTLDDAETRSLPPPQAGCPLGDPGPLPVLICSARRSSIHFVSVLRVESKRRSISSALSFCVKAIGESS